MAEDPDWWMMAGTVPGHGEFYTENGAASD
jgi:hypothetical protein